MALKESITQDLKLAMRSGEEAQKNALRQLLAGIRQAELEKRGALAREKAKAGQVGQSDLAELEHTQIDAAEVVSVIQREAKARRESIIDAQKAGRPDLVPGYEKELAIIEAYLPKQLSRDEIVALAQAAIAEAGATDAKQMGAVMKLLTPRTRGLADGRQVSEIVRELLAAR